MARLTRNFSSLEFYQLDKLLFLSDKYHTTLSPLAKLVYTFFYDRSRLSDIKGFHDENGDVFFFYKIETIMHMLNCSKPKALAVKKELLNLGLLEEVKTGRASKLYLHALENDGYTEEDIRRFNEPEEDETIWKQEEIEKQRKSFTETIEKRTQKKEKISGIIPIQTKENEENPDSKLRGKKSLPHSISLINQHSEEKQNTTKSISFTSEVNRIDPSNNNIIRIDHNIDNNIDHDLAVLYKEQLLFDLSKFYDDSIIQALSTIADYEPVEAMHRLLQKALLDLARGKFNAYPEAQAYSISINHILSELNGYHDTALAYDIRQTLIRATRFIYSGKQTVKNKEAYYYMSIQKAMLEHIQAHYELERNEGNQYESIQGITND